MKPDDLWVAQDGNFTQVRSQSSVARFASYAGGVIGMLVGPALMITLGVVGAFELPTLIGGVAIIVVVGAWGWRRSSRLPACSDVSVASRNAVSARPPRCRIRDP